MKILNKALRREFAQPGRCELCNRWCKKREGHHLWHRVPEISIRINLISLGSTLWFACHCHRKIGDGHILASRVLEIVALREHCRPEEITEVMHWMRRLVKPTPGQLEAALKELSVGARAIAVKEMAEAEKQLTLARQRPK
jgi:hypothetical protein